MSLRHLRPGLAPCLVAFAAIWPTNPAFADESGTSVYLLGSGGPGAAVLPPVTGVFVDDTIYIYDGKANARRDFVIGGNVVADVDATLPAEFITMLWVPSTNFAGGTLAVGGTVPIAAPMIRASAVLTGPGGRTLGVSKDDSAMVVGDPLLTASLGWTSGKTHVAVSTLVNIPVGHYREGQLANLAFHRWATDVSLAVSWHDDESGWDVSGKAGLTFNGTNKITDYNSGNDLHLEAAIEKKLSPAFTLGIQGYQLFQITGDTGPGATLGPFKGRVTGLGGTMSYSTILGKSPSTFRLRVFREFWQENRMQGTAVMLSVTVPLKMNIPASPAG